LRRDGAHDGVCAAPASSTSAAASATRPRGPVRARASSWMSATGDSADVRANWPRVGLRSAGTTPSLSRGWAVSVPLGHLSPQRRGRGHPGAASRPPSRPHASKDAGRVRPGPPHAWATILRGSSACSPIHPRVGVRPAIGERSSCSERGRGAVGAPRSRAAASPAAPAGAGRTCTGSTWFDQRLGGQEVEPTRSGRRSVGPRA